MSPTYDSKRIEPINYLVEQKVPVTKTEELYDRQKFQKMAFGQVWGPQSHLTRRKLILKDHPQIAKLLVATKPYSMILAVLLVTLNMSLAYMVKDSSWTVILLTVYIFGGTINHTLHVLIHDFTHWAGHKSLTINKAFAIFCNVPFGIPSAISFGKYHSDHHNYLGEEGMDPDLPTHFETRIGKYAIVKILFFALLSPIYALRPFLLMHKKMSIQEIINFAFIFMTNVLIYKFWGGAALAYVVIGGYISIGAHPAAIHVIAEHAEFTKGLETFDYLGIWNFFNLNLGYHIQHHDFPTCPWYNLPKIRKAAPQYYERLPYHTSYVKVLWKFFFDPNFNLYNRTIRIPEKKAE